MNVVSRAFVLAVVAAVSLAVFAAVSAQTPTPTPTPTSTPTATPSPTATPTATPTPTPTSTPTPTPDASPVPTSIITTNFVHDGSPIIIHVGGEPRVFANGEECHFPGGGPAVVWEIEATRWTVSWPPGRADDPPDCSQMGAVVSICFGVCTELVWRGVDAAVDLEVPDRPGYSVVTARFMRDGEPVEASVTGWDYQADGRTCLTETPAVLSVAPRPIENISTISRFWPIEQSFNPACQTIGSVITAKFTSEQFGEGQGTFGWSGQDAVFDMVFPGAASQLPITGGPPGEEPSIVWTLLASIAGGTVTMSGFGLTLLALTRHPRKRP